MIKEVRCSRLRANGMDGIRIAFVREEHEQDIFDFYDKEDVNHLTHLVSLDIAPEYLLMEVRDRIGVTLH